MHRSPNSQIIPSMPRDDLYADGKATVVSPHRDRGGGQLKRGKEGRIAEVERMHERPAVPVRGPGMRGKHEETIGTQGLLEVCA